jgi:hypothetical protein
MKTNTRRTAALKILAATGIKQRNYEPPYISLLWRIGFDLPPPHFICFLANFLIASSYFTLAWGLLTYLLLWLTQGQPKLVLFAYAGAGGLFLGLTMASYYAYGRRKHELPLWQELND